ncbi:hypothetical protein LIER_10027 [Lithospermum erythrorhizon]|uniref:Uncharacterized protein n=1 Tax=Lithospermum erythrorhizon TaxID=34254 RepID=A0AAV3PHX1_LITER
MHQHETKIDDLPTFSLGLSQLEENEQDGGSEGEEIEKQPMKDDCVRTRHHDNPSKIFALAKIAKKKAEGKQERTQIRLSKTKVLKLIEEDVYRVYKLPRTTKKINLDDCSVASITKLRT